MIKPPPSFSPPYVVTFWIKVSWAYMYGGPKREKNDNTKEYTLYIKRKKT